MKKIVQMSVMLVGAVVLTACGAMQGKSQMRDSLDFTQDEYVEEIEVAKCETKPFNLEEPIYLDKFSLESLGEDCKGKLRPGPVIGKDVFIVIKTKGSYCTSYVSGSTGQVTQRCHK
jgi:hypothetical protein